MSSSCSVAISVRAVPRSSTSRVGSSATPASYAKAIGGTIFTLTRRVGTTVAAASGQCRRPPTTTRGPCSAFPRGRSPRRATRRSLAPGASDLLQSTNASITSTRLVRVLHPFHPLGGQQFVCVGERCNRYGRRLLLQVGGETICAVPPQWTDQVAPDPRAGHQQPAGTRPRRRFGGARASSGSPLQTNQWERPLMCQGNCAAYVKGIMPRSAHQSPLRRGCDSMCPREMSVSSREDRFDSIRHALDIWARCVIIMMTTNRHHHCGRQTRAPQAPSPCRRGHLERRPREGARAEVSRVRLLRSAGPRTGQGRDVAPGLDRPRVGDRRHRGVWRVATDVLSDHSLL